ncbi:MAG: DUF1080 domain-containing protein [Niabella sp.]
MKRVFLLAVLSLSLIFLWAQRNDGWVNLFNQKDLYGWDTYLDIETDSLGNKVSSAPLGINNDPNRVFSVVNDEGVPVIRVSGKIWGGLSTQKEYADYHLQLKFKWGKDSTWGKKRGKPRDSGLLYHGVGLLGANREPWLTSQEFQIEEGNTGDYWGVEGAGQEIHAIKRNDRKYYYHSNGPLLAFYRQSETGRHCKKDGDGEYDRGSWNTLDLYCFKEKSIHVVNGKVVMILSNSFKVTGNTRLPLTKGKIQLQSEGAEIFYKDIRIRSIASLPDL